MEDFIETHYCKLRGILRSLVLRVLCDLIKNVSPYGGRQNLTPVELSEDINMSLWVCVRPYLNLLDRRICSFLFSLTSFRTRTVCPKAKRVPGYHTLKRTYCLHQ